MLKRFLIRTIGFLAPIIFIALLLEIFLRLIPNDYKYKNSQLQEEKKHIKTLILGSSHSMYGFNPKYFLDRAYNLGHVSQTIDLDYHLLKKNIQKLPNLKTVVIRLSYTTLHEQVKNGNEDWRLKNYKIYYNIDEVSSNLKFNSEVLSVKLSNNLDRIISYFKNDNENTVSSLGWVSFEMDHSLTPIEDIGPITAKKHTAENNQLVKENLQYLDKILKLCDSKKVNVILVTLPAHRSYRDNLNKDQLKMVLNSGKILENKYENCTYLNLMDNKKFDDTDFYDADHLNTTGAKKLSLFINNIISSSEPSL